MVTGAGGSKPGDIKEQIAADRKTLKDLGTLII